MIAADKKVFESHFAAENFIIHKKMLSYYQGGMEGATIASLATIHMMVADIMRNEAEHEGSNHHKMFFVYALCVMGIVCAFMNSVLSTTVKIFGNAALLCEAGDEEVVQIIRGVRRKQEECTRWWLGALVLLALQAAAWSWDSGNTPVIVTESLVFVAALVVAVYFARKTIRLFSADNNDSGPLVFKTSLFARYGGDMKTNDRKSKMKVIRSNSGGVGGGSSSSFSNLSDDEINRELSKLRNEYRTRLKGITWRGVLWFRNLQHSDNDPAEGVFTKSYAVLENGSLLFYKNKDEYLHFTSTIDDNHSVKLLDYELESNAKRVAGLGQQGVSFNKSLRTAVFGTDELSFVDMIGADFDVNSASSAYKFCLIPKQTSELSVHEPIFLMAEDKKTFTECIRGLRESMQAYEDLHAVFNVNRGARLVMDPKAALAFLHDRSTARQMEATEKEHARQVKGQLKVQASTRVTSDNTDLTGFSTPYDALKAAINSDDNDLNSDLASSQADPASSSGMLGSLSKSLSMKKPSSLGGGGGGAAILDKKALALERQLKVRARLKAIEGRGQLWTKSVNPVKAPRSFLSEKYAVLDNGKLYFYESKDNYIELGDTLAEPLNLRDFKISEDRASVNKHDVKSNNFSIMRYVRQAVNDTNEIRSRDRLGISFDYLTALNNYKFCLKPSSSRAKRSGYYGIICMSENKKAYLHWVALLRSAIECLAELDALSASADHKESIQVSLTLDAEELVKKNNLKIKHQVDLT